MLIFNEGAEKSAPLILSAMSTQSIQVSIESDLESNDFFANVVIDFMGYVNIHVHSSIVIVDHQKSALFIRLLASCVIATPHLVTKNKPSRASDYTEFVMDPLSLWPSQIKITSGYIGDMFPPLTLPVLHLQDSKALM